MDENEEDLHVCNLCGATLRGLDAYVSHRSSNGGRTATACPGKPTGRSKELGSRSRRPSSDQATAFMESLGLHLASPAVAGGHNDSHHQSHHTRDKAESSSTPGIDADEASLCLWPSPGSVAATPTKWPRDGLGSKPTLLSFDRQGNKGSPIASRPSHAGSDPSHHGLLNLDVPLASGNHTSQTEFMRHFQLMNVSTVGVADEDEAQPSDGGQEATRWKLWQPEREDEALWSDVVLGEPLASTAANGVEAIKRLPDDGRQRRSTGASAAAAMAEVPLLSPRPKRRRTLSKRYSPHESIGSSHKSTTTSESEPPSHSAFVTCPTCESRTLAHQFAKHLISHYHRYHSKVPPTAPAFSRLVLAHLPEIVRLCPFRCDECSFYCNTEDDFLRHWNVNHDDIERNSMTKTETSVYWCSFCSFTAATGASMGEHLAGERHRDIAAALSRVVPIVIRRVRLLSCPDCGLRFRLRVALRRHREASHGHANTVISHACLYCSARCADVQGLARHVFVAHPERRAFYHCFTCRLEFKSAKCRDRHRRSIAHREAVDAAKVRGISCERCGQYVADLAALRDHVTTEHAAEMSRCGACGLSFPLAQELSAHVRRGCEAMQINEPLGEAAVQCREVHCGFSARNVNELLFHQCLRHGRGSDGVGGGFQCLVCERTLKSRANLWRHVRLHGSAERCKECYRIFGHVDDLAKHMRTSHADLDAGATFKCPDCPYVSGKRRLLEAHRRRSHFQAKPCPLCGETMATYKKALAHRQSHQSRDEGLRAGHPCRQCHYVAATRWDLKSHMATHDDSSKKSVECVECDFRCSRRSELVRHAKRVHGVASASGRSIASDAFKCNQCGRVSATRQHYLRHAATHRSSDEDGGLWQCRLCPRSFKSEELLRKHVLKTDIHKDRNMYECDHCSFATNSSIQFRGHVVSSHVGGAAAFANAHQAKVYTKNYFKVIT